jgi:glucose/arabinose dehydrogenase
MRARYLAVLFAVMTALAAALIAGGGAGAAPAQLPLGAEPPPSTPETLPAGTTIEPVVSNLSQPIAMAFDPAGRLFITEKQGTVLLYANGTLQSAPVITFPVEDAGEQGLLGITLDPDFSSNHYIYVYYTRVRPNPGSVTENIVVRFEEHNGAGSNPVQIFSSPDDAAATNHNGGNIHFGPDGKLYITIGDDGSRPDFSQNLGVKNGKIHRINSDGSIPGDNPFFTGPQPSIYAYGLRNSFDFAWDPTNNTLWASENGPNCDDELNHIFPGNNYGWRPSYPCDDPDPDSSYNTLPARWWIPLGDCCEGPTGLEFYRGTQIPGWTNGLFMCAVNTGTMRHFHLNAARTAVDSVGLLQGINCNLDVQTGPDGALYYMDGGGYSPGTIKRIAGSGPSFTPTVTPTARATSTPVASHTSSATATATSTATATATVTPTREPDDTFVDVFPGDYFYTPVRYLVQHNAISGYNDAAHCPGGSPCFLPYATASRQQAMKILVIAFGFPIVTPATGQTFVDVPRNSVFFPFIETAAARQIVHGYSCGSGCAEFRPGAPVTRAQIAKIVVIAAGWPLLDPEQGTFSDVLPNSVFYPYIETAVMHGVLDGYPDHTFKPQQPAKRGQIAKIVYNAVAASGTAPK